MKAERNLFVLLAVFLGGSTIVYWFTSKDPTGTTALALSAGLGALIGYYALFSLGRRMAPRPSDRGDADIAEGAGELGFFSPHSWWPLIAAGRLRDGVPRPHLRLVAVHHRCGVPRRSSASSGSCSSTKGAQPSRANCRRHEAQHRSKLRSESYRARLMCLPCASPNVRWCRLFSAKICSSLHVEPVTAPACFESLPWRSPADPRRSV